MDGETLNSPKEIEVLIHYHCCPEPHPQADAPAVKRAVEKLLACKALEPVAVPPDNPQYYRTTELGSAWVEALKRVPVPKIAYIDGSGNILELHARKSVVAAHRRDG